MKQILCFGDSNTWAHNPENGLRHDWNTRWTGVLAQLLGEEYHVIEDGISGRTTVFDDPYFDWRNGGKALPYALLAHAPIDILIINLGANDLKFTNAIGSAKGIAALIRMARNTVGSNSKMRPLGPDAKILVISPILSAPDAYIKRPRESTKEGCEQKLRLPTEFRLVCEQYGVELLDGALYARASDIDCFHMDAENHKKLGHAVYQKIMEMEKV